MDILEMICWLLNAIGVPSIIAFCYECLRDPNSPSLVLRINRWVRGAKRSGKVAIQYNKSLHFSTSIDIVTISNWARQKHNEIRFTRIGDYRYAAESTKSKMLSSEINFHFNERTGIITDATIKVTDSRKGNKMAESIWDSHEYGNELKDALATINEAHGVSGVKESFKLNLSRSPETRYFLNMLGLKKAEGKTKRGNRIRIWDTYIEVEGDFNFKQINEIMRLAKLA